MAERKKIALIDGSSYIYRAFYAVRGLANSKGFPTGAAYGFIGMLRKVVDDIRPDYLLVAYDAKGPTFRHELFADYKAHRPEMPDDLKPQIPRIKEIVSAYNIESLEMPGYEADDIIAQIVRELPADVEAIIVTGDKDLGQLVSDRVTLLDTMKDRITDQAAIREKYGTDPAGLAEIFGLAGDSSDNIPGVPGIGEKGAVELIKKYGTIEEVLRHIDDFTGKRRELLERHGDLALLSKRLFILNHPVPVDFDLADARISPPDTQRLKEIFADLEFHTYLRELERPGTGIAVPHETITDDAALSSVISRAQKAAMLAVDLETTSLSPVDAEIVGISLCFSDDAAYYIPLAHRYLGAPKQLDRAKTLSALGPLLTSPGVPKAGQNIKYDYLVMKNYGIDISPVAFDTMVASYVINPSRRTHNLETISLEYLGHRPISYKDVAGKGKGQITFDQVPVEEASRYSAEDAYLTYLLIPILKTKMDELSLGRLFDDIEMPLVIVLADMEMTGVKVDEGALGALSREFTEKLVVLEHTIIEEAGQQFNINSTQQLARILFDKLGLGGLKKTKTGFSTDNDVLTALADAHSIIPHILEYRTLAKLKSTYVDALPRLINGKTGRIHTSYNQTVAATGRLSSSDPNLQNIPIRTPEGRRIRAAFVPRQGCVLVSADYSQIELRLLAHFCKDPALTRTFFDDEDIHASTAAPDIFRRSRGRDGRHAPQGKDHQLRDHLRHLAPRPCAGAGNSVWGCESLYRDLFREVRRGKGLLRNGDEKGRGRRLRHHHHGQAPLSAGAEKLRPQREGLRPADGGQHPHPGQRRRPHQDGDDQPFPAVGRRRAGSQDDHAGARRAGLGGADSGTGARLRDRQGRNGRGDAAQRPAEGGYKQRKELGRGALGTLKSWRFPGAMTGKRGQYICPPKPP